MGGSGDFEKQRETTRGRYLVVALQGGLGNQLFQFASGLGIATQLDAELLLDGAHVSASERWLPAMLGEHYKEASRASLARVGIGFRTPRTRDSVLRRALGHAVDAERRLRGVTPRRMPVGSDLADPGRFREDLFSIDLPTYLWAYLQSERYFSPVADLVAERLTLPSAPTMSTVRPTVGVSFRRGDFVRLGFALPLSYYEKALALVKDEITDPEFVLFGDDPAFVEFAVDWVSHRFGPATSAYDIVEDVPAQLALSSSCQHHVIANSSFAWWGAWLGDRRTSPRLVVAPEQYKRWGEDIFPSRWVAVGST